MPIKVRCPHCDTPHNLADNLAGKKIKCKNCGDAVRVPQPEPAAVGARDSGCVVGHGMPGEVVIERVLSARNKPKHNLPYGGGGRSITC